MRKLICFQAKVYMTQQQISPKPENGQKLVLPPVSRLNILLVAELKGNTMKANLHELKNYCNKVAN